MGMTWAQRVVRSALRVQASLTPEVPKELREAGKGRKGRLVIEGEDGGVFYLLWNGKELVEEDTDEDVRNDFIMHSTTLLDLATGELGVREAVAARLITITGDRSIYDTEDVTQLLEKLQSNIIESIKVKK